MMNINQSLKVKLDKIEGLAENALEDQVRKIADAAIDITLTSSRIDAKGRKKVGAVDTGAYISSFSITYGPGRPRGKSSRRKPRKRTDLYQLGESARADLYSDIERLDFSKVDRVELRNNSPHAELVEYKHAYYIFAKLEREFNV